MSTQSVNAVIIDFLGVDEDNSDSSIFSTPLSQRGSTKRDAISVEDYHFDRHRRRKMLASHTTIKSEFPILIDLDHYNDDDDDDLRFFGFSPNPKCYKSEQSSSSSSSLTLSTFECEICVESKPTNELFRISGCSHSYCNSCVSNYIAAKLQDNILSVNCPVSACSGSLEPYQCRDILPREVFDRWGDALCEAVVMQSKRFYCPYKDCSALVFLDDSKEKLRESECPHCNRMVCVECGTKWHPEISCTDFQKLGENERERDDILLKKMAENNKWKRCPSCKFYIEKSMGCLYMKCRCGLAFCYNCGTPSKDNTHYCYHCKH